jgi:hypothetical protein
MSFPGTLGRRPAGLRGRETQPTSSQTGVEAMDVFKKLACVALLSIPAIALAASPKSCDAVNLGPEVLAKFPNAVRACHDLSEKNGGIYMHYVAKVVDVAKDGVTVEMLDTNNKAVSRVKFVPAADQMAKVEGKDESFGALKKGTKLDLYIEHSKWGLYASPDGKRMTIVSQETL